MPRHRFKSASTLSTESLFIIGGEDMSPVYLHPGTSNGRRWGLYSPYNTGTAAVDKMQNDDHPFMPFDFGFRDTLIEQIKVKVVDADKIEKERQRVADAFNRLILSQSVDVQG